MTTTIEKAEQQLTTDLKSLASDVVSRAMRAGASAAECVVREGDEFSTVVRLGQVETLKESGSRSIGVRVFFGQRAASTYSSDFSAAGIDRMLSSALELAKITSEDPFAGIPDAAKLGALSAPLDLYHEDVYSLPGPERIDYARRAEKAALDTDPRLKNSDGGSFDAATGRKILANSHGFIGEYRRSYCSVAAVPIAQDEQGNMQRDYWYSVARQAEALEDVTTIGRHAAHRAVRRLGARQLSTRRAPVLFVPELARGLFGHFVGAIRGPSQYRRSSFLLEAAGTQIFPTFLNIAERPHLLQGLASSPFDAEGVATRDRELVSAGVLQGYVLGSYSARKLGLTTTGNAGGVHNLLVAVAADAAATCSGTFEQLLQRMGEGLMVTELMGPGVNGVTGDYSRGASGFWVEQGAIAYPVHEVTIAGNLRHMLRGIVAVGSDLDAQGAIRTGSVLIEAMTIAGE
jgi:PmbA protein